MPGFSLDSALLIVRTPYPSIISKHKQTHTYTYTHIYTYTNTHAHTKIMIDHDKQTTVIENTTFRHRLVCNYTAVQLVEFFHILYVKLVTFDKYI